MFLIRSVMDAVVMGSAILFISLTCVKSNVFVAVSNAHATHRFVSGHSGWAGPRRGARQRQRYHCISCALVAVQCRFT